MHPGSILPFLCSHHAYIATPQSELQALQRKQEAFFSQEAKRMHEQEEQQRKLYRDSLDGALASVRALRPAIDAVKQRAKDDIHVLCAVAKVG